MSNTVRGQRRSHSMRVAGAPWATYLRQLYGPGSGRSPFAVPWASTGNAYSTIREVKRGDDDETLAHVEAVGV